MAFTKSLLGVATLLGALCISTTMCQQGLGDGFQPSVSAVCSGSTMTIRVATKEPFEGIIHAPNRTEPGCFVQGNGALKTYLRIKLDATDAKTGRCGVKYDKAKDERRLAIAVRAHETIELLEDRRYVVRCGRVGFQNTLNELSLVELKVTPVSRPERRLTTVIEGSEYKLRAVVTKHDPNFGFLMRRCFAFDDTESTRQLVDDRGCVMEKLISDFEYDEDKGTAEATIFSMFRMAHSNRTYFQCDVAICAGGCTKPVCDGSRRLVKAGGGGPLGSLFGDGDGDGSDGSDGDGSDDPFDRPADDAVTTSTSVFVAQPGTEAAVCYEKYCGEPSVFECTGSFYGDADEWLLWLCIAFGILFIIMLLINIFLCSAMTCSCTRSEIIEKEPSIYDDYDYDSQYGYTNGKAYGSESDYGGSEEYGIPADHGDEIGSGTYSKYSQSHHGGGNSTMGRSRH